MISTDKVNKKASDSLVTSESGKNIDNTSKEADEIVANQSRG